ncbi:SEC-C metal-binding domain-containing protein [Thioalkalivibrio paradoxus]|nr:SEC-C metal-binding domain-containing protein [Thioalkalivibrio paradoxus]
MVGEIAGMVLLDHPRERFHALLMKLATTFEADERSSGIPYSVADVGQAFSGPSPRPFQHPHFLSFYNPIEIRERQLRWKRERGGRGDDDLGDNVLGIGRDDLGWQDEPLPLAFDTPYVREHPKVGRNDPCPCGSGRKYKKCCLGKT